jgi:ATP-dependent DNA helicase MPH1
MNFAPTQAPKGYNQHAAYVAGLSTQLGNRAGLKFRQDEDGQLGFLAKARIPVYITDEDEPARGGGEETQSDYELGSFICDDENVDYASEWCERLWIWTADDG